VFSVSWLFGRTYRSGIRDQQTTTSRTSGRTVRSGVHRQRADDGRVLLAEVLGRHSEPVRPLPPRTSVLDRVSGELAGALTGGSGGGWISQDLEKANAFVVSLDAARSWLVSLPPGPAAGVQVADAVLQRPVHQAWAAGRFSGARPRCSQGDPAHGEAPAAQCPEDGIPLSDILADSGYAHRDADAWAQPLRRQRPARPGPAPRRPRPQGTFHGAIIANGNLYCPAMTTFLSCWGHTSPGHGTTAMLIKRLLGGNSGLVFQVVLCRGCAAAERTALANSLSRNCLRCLLT
jgi:hypothetical protein